MAMPTTPLSSNRATEPAFAAPQAPPDPGAPPAPGAPKATRASSSGSCRARATRFLSRLSWPGPREVGKRRQRLLARVQHRAAARAATTPINSPFTAHRLANHKSPIAANRSPFTTHSSPLTVDR